MIKTILIAAVSADFMIAQHPDQSSLEWTSKEDKAFFVKKTKECGVMIMGRKTFETIGKPLPGRLIVVMTRDVGTLPATSVMSGVEWTDASPQEILADLDRRGYGSVALCGGASVYSAFLAEGFVDELFLTVEPYIFGKGTPLFSSGTSARLSLVESEPLGEHTILIHYNVQKDV